MPDFPTSPDGVVLYLLEPVVLGVLAAVGEDIYHAIVRGARALWRRSVGRRRAQQTQELPPQELPPTQARTVARYIGEHGPHELVDARTPTEDDPRRRGPWACSGDCGMRVGYRRAARNGTRTAFFAKLPREEHGPGCSAQ